MGKSTNIPQLMRLQNWVKARFKEGEAPCEKTLLKMCREGRIPAKQFGGRGDWWVEVQVELNQTGNALVDKVLSSG